jgi:hypothetical protein
LPEQGNYAPQVHKAQEVIFPTLVGTTRRQKLPSQANRRFTFQGLLQRLSLRPSWDFGFSTPPSVRGDHLDTLALKLRVERVRVVRPVCAINSFGFSPMDLDTKACSTSVTSCGEALVTLTARGRPELSATAMSFVPLPRLVVPTAPLPFSPVRTYCL